MVKEALLFFDEGTGARPEPDELRLLGLHPAQRPAREAYGIPGVTGQEFQKVVAPRRTATAAAC